MGSIRKKLTYETPLENIIPPMITDIIRDYVKDFAAKNGIGKYEVSLGKIREIRFITIFDKVSPVPRHKLMSPEARIIEHNLFQKYDIDTGIYEKKRDRDIIKYRQRVQFFMIVYSNMSLMNIGRITGGFDHANLTHVKYKFCRQIVKNDEFKKEILATDIVIYNALGLTRSKLFDKGLNIHKEITSQSRKKIRSLQILATA